MLDKFYDQSEKGITVPYPPLFNKINRNHGFADLRGRPDLVNSIPEASSSEALKEFLICLAEPSSPFFTLGCDLGTHVEKDEKGLPLHVAGGYVQFMSAQYATWSGDDYFALTKVICEALDPRSSGHTWVLRFECVSVLLKLDHFCDTIPSLWTWFFASASTLALALESREQLVRELRTVMNIREPV
jgi:hypothetical protein